MTINENLASFFVKKGIAGQKQIDAALLASNDSRTSVYNELQKDRTVNQIALGEALGEYFHLPFLNLTSVTIDPVIISIIPLYLMKSTRIVPYKLEGNKMIILVDEPYRVLVKHAVSYYIPDRQLRFELVTKAMMDELLTAIQQKKTKSDVMSDIRDSTTKAEAQAQAQTQASVKAAGETNTPGLVDAPTIKIADSILREATLDHASDIHIEPFEDVVKVRYRIDGVLTDSMTLSKAVYPAILARYKIISGLDISEHRLPQDGKITLPIDGVAYDYRVSTLPMIFGEKIVIRIFGNDESMTNMSRLGFDEHQEAVVKGMLKFPHGLILLTGPTGSGKTTTLYAFIRSLNNENVNITTIEDPVENYIQGVNQTQVNEKVGLTFAASLRSILRQDPNVIMIGEIRDSETATIAVRAAITGHLVFSTLHTNNAYGTIPRLIDMGVPGYLVSDSLVGAISQRLVRRLCPYCKKEHLTTAEEMSKMHLDEPATIYEPVGCANCHGTGYHGRTGVYEIMRVDESIKAAINSRDFSVSNLYRAAIASGMVPLLEAGKKLVLDGTTSYAEYAKLIDNESDEIMSKEQKAEASAGAALDIAAKAGQ